MINIGRSNVIQEDELLEALEKNWIREAILDVFDTGKNNFLVIEKCLRIKMSTLSSIY